VVSDNRTGSSVVIEIDDTTCRRRQEEMKNPSPTVNMFVYLASSLYRLFIRYFSFNVAQVSRPTTAKLETRNKSSDTTIELFGQQVDWLDGRHYSAEELDQYRLVGDIEMDRILELTGISSNDELSDNFSNTIRACAEIYHKEEKRRRQKTVFDDNEPSALAIEDLAMYEFYKHYHDHLPEWVDWDQLQRGIDVFILYSPVAGQALFYLSLVPGFSIPNIAKVLEQTRYLVPPSTPKQVRNRLMDTGGFISTALVPSEESGLSASSLRPGGTAWITALQVRTLHAKVRRSILTKKGIQWNTKEYGVPINQEDMSATLLAFSVNVLIGIQFVAGEDVSVDSQRDYIALWRYLGWLLGIESKEDDSTFRDIFSNKTCSGLPPLDPCGFRINGKSDDDSIVHAHATLESIIVHLMHPNEYSGEVARHLLTMGQTQTESFTLAYLYRSFMCRRFIGNELADALKLPTPNYSIKSCFAYALTYFILVLMRIYSLLTMHSNWFRAKAYKRHLSLVWKFYQMWTSNHGKRMNKAAHEAMNVTRLDDDCAQPSCCPFALIMPSKSKDNYLKIE